MAEKGLGAGLGALLGDMLDEANPDFLYLPISKVETAPNQPRKRFDEVQLQELADSISEHGIIQPLTVRELPSGYYQIIAGERRWRAARMAGLTEVPARIIEADDATAMELALVENLQRADLNPLEEAEGYRALMDEYGFTQERVAERVGVSRPSVANALRLLSLTRPVRDLIETGKLSAGHARAVLQLRDPRAQEELSKQIVREGMSVRKAEAAAAKNEKDREKKVEETKRPGGLQVDYTAEAERKLTELLGRRIRIIEGRRKGHVEIEYYGDEDLQSVIEALESLAH